MSLPSLFQFRRDNSIFSIAAWCGYQGRIRTYSSSFAVVVRETHPVLKTDVKNAFNSVSRAHLLNELAASFSDIYNQMYSGYNHLIFNNGTESVVLQSAEGVHQGDPLGPALFSVVIHPLLIYTTRIQMYIYWLTWMTYFLLVLQNVSCLL